MLREVDRAESVLESFLGRVKSMGDSDRIELARAREAVDEAFHADAWGAAIEVAAMRADAYLAAWIRIGDAFVPDRLEELLALGSGADPGEVARWQTMARLIRLGIDDAVLALLGADTLPPPHIRELYRPWKQMLEAAHARENAP